MTLISQADFIVHTDAAGKEVLETSRSTIFVPATKWNKKGIKWLEDKKTRKEAGC